MAHGTWGKRWHDAGLGTSRVVSNYLMVLQSCARVIHNSLDTGDGLSDLVLKHQRFSNMVKLLEKDDWECPSKQFSEELVNWKITGSTLFDSMNGTVHGVQDLLSSRVTAWSQVLTTAANRLQEAISSKATLHNEALVGDAALQKTVMDNPALKAGISIEVSRLTNSRQCLMGFVRNYPAFDGESVGVAAKTCKEAVWQGRTAIGAAAAVEEIRKSMPTHENQRTRALGVQLPRPLPQQRAQITCCFRTHVRRSCR